MKTDANTVAMAPIIMQTCLVSPYPRRRHIDVLKNNGTTHDAQRMSALADVYDKKFIGPAS